jgi:hypothetical protein
VYYILRVPHAVNSIYICVLCTFGICTFVFYLLGVPCSYQSAVGKLELSRRCHRSVGVAQALGDVHNLADSDVLGQATHGQDVVEADFAAALLTNVVCWAIVLSQAGLVLLLPLPPEAVDLRVVKEEQGLCRYLSAMTWGDGKKLVTDRWERLSGSSRRQEKRG